MTRTTALFHNSRMTISRVNKHTSIEVICFLLILLFMYAAVSKVIDYEKFRVQLGQSPLLTGYAQWVAIGVPVVEIAISILLAIPKYRLLGLYAAFDLMVMFTTYIITVTRFSDYIPCSCGGVLQHMSWNQHLIFNLVFVVLSGVGISLQSFVRR